MRNILVIFLVSLFLVSTVDVVKGGNDYLHAKTNVGDRVNCIYISDNGNYIAIGGNYGVYLANKNGNLLWEDKAVREITRVQITYDSKYVGSSEGYYVLSDGRKLTFNKDYFAKKSYDYKKEYMISGQLATLTFNNVLIEISGKNYTEPEWWNITCDKNIPYRDYSLYELINSSDYFDYKDYSRNYFIRNKFNINKIPIYGFDSLILPFPDKFTVIGNRNSVQVIRTTDPNEIRMGTYLWSIPINIYNNLTSYNYNDNKTTYFIWPFTGRGYFEKISTTNYPLEITEKVYRLYYIKDKVIAVTSEGFHCFDLDGNKAYFEKVKLTPSSYTNNMNFLAVGRGEYLYVLNNEKVFHEFKTEGKITSVVINPKNIVACGTENGNLYIFDLTETQTKENQITGETQIQEIAVVTQKEEVKENTDSTQPIQETKNTPGFELSTIIGGSLIVAYYLKKRRN